MNLNNGQYRCSCGYWMGRDGSRRIPRVWMLGADRQEAKRREKIVTALWQGLRRQRGKGAFWTIGDIERVEESFSTPMDIDFERATFLPPMPPMLKANNEAPAAMKLWEAFDAFKDEKSQELAAGQISTDWYYAICNWLETVKLGFGEDRGKRMAQNVLLSDIDNTKLRAAVLYFISRPVSAKTGEKISAKSALNFISVMRQSFDWFDRKGYWQAPRRWEDEFAIDRKKLRKTEGNKRRVPIYTIEELTKLWESGSEWQRLCLLLGLNFGWTVKEMATLTRDMIQDDGQTIRIAKDRNKTGVYGQWEAWPITAKYLRAAMKNTPTNAGNFAILNQDGKPLVYWTNACRNDAVHSAWFRLLSNCPDVRPLSHKYCRKTGSQLIRDLMGKETSQAFLAQTDGTVQEDHYNNPNFAKVAEGLRRVWDETLEKIFRDDVPKPQPKNRNAIAA